MSGSACGSGCGYCGGCTAAWDRGSSRPRGPICATCAHRLGAGAVVLTVGSFCSPACADEFEAKRIAAAAVVPAHLKGVSA